MSSIVLSCKYGGYYSALDEELFFVGLNKISSIVRYYGEGRKLYLHFSKRNISSCELRNILGLFRRYKVDMKPLAIFLNKRNKKWFYDNKQAFWHKKVFG